MARKKKAAASATPEAASAQAKKTKAATNGGNLGFEGKLWAAADKLRGHMDAGEYKNVVLPLIFLKYVSDAFEDKHAALKADKQADAEDPDEYLADRIFWVPKPSRWDAIKANARQPDIGKRIDNAMQAIEKANEKLRGVLPKDFARPTLPAQQLGDVIDLVSGIALGDADARAQDVLGRVYEYFLGRFADAEGKSGGEFYTPRSVVKLLVEIIEPFKGRVFDPCCGSGGMFVLSERFVVAHGGKRTDISIYGQESNPTTWKLCQMNLAIRGIECNLGQQNADSFHNDLHRDLKADYILANPPFNVSAWGGDRLKDDVRWKFGTPPPGNANFAWIQHFIHHLCPTGVAGFVMANGSMSANQSGEGDIRRKIIEADQVDCVVALPGQLFYTTQIPVCLWFLARDKKNHRFRDRRGHTLFIDARKLGHMVDRRHREFSDDDIARVANAYHAWRGEKPAGKYADQPGFCRNATTDDIRNHGHVLTPGRYVGAAEVEDDGEAFDEKMARLVDTLREQQAATVTLDAAISANLKELGYGE